MHPWVFSQFRLQTWKQHFRHPYQQTDSGYHWGEPREACFSNRCRTHRLPKDPAGLSHIQNPGIKMVYPACKELTRRTSAPNGWDCPSHLQVPRVLSATHWPWVKTQIVPPVNIPIPTKLGSKMGGEFTYPKMGSHWFWTMASWPSWPPVMFKVPTLWLELGSLGRLGRVPN